MFDFLAAKGDLRDEKARKMQLGSEIGHPFLADQDALFRWMDQPREGPELVWYANPHTLGSWRRGGFCPRAIDPVVVDGGLTKRVLSREMRRPVQDLSLSFPGFADALFTRLCESRARIAFVGGREEDVTRAAAHVAARFAGLQIVYAGSGYAEERSEEATLAALRSSAPDVVFLSMGSPRQERFALRIAQTVPRPMVILAAGAFVRHTARQIRHYPIWVTRLGIRWLWRLPREPKVAGRILRLYLPFWVRHRVLRRPIPVTFATPDQENSA